MSFKWHHLKAAPLRIDADLIAWFKAQAGQYQTRINAALREYVEEHDRRGGKKKDLTLIFPG